MRAGKSALDFIVIGAQKSGTTSLFEYLRQHPELHLPPSKEAPYFSHDRVYERGWEQYLDTHFAGADPSARWGTVTPSYMVGGLYEAAREDEDSDVTTVPSRIRARLPEVRLVALLRDPIERAESHFRMARLTGLEQRTAERAVEELLDPAAAAAARRRPRETSGYIAWGEYGRLLGGYLEEFERDRLLVLTTDELATEPEAVLERVFGFLGVQGFTPDNLGVRYRVGGQERQVRALDPGGARRAIAGLRPAKALWHSVPDRLRSRIDGAYERLSYRVDLWNRQGEAGDGDGETAAFERLRGPLEEHFRRDAGLLQERLALTPPWLAGWRG